MIDSDTKRELCALVGPDRLATGSTERHAYSYDSQQVNAEPDAVVHVLSTDEIVAVVRLVLKRGIPLVARGAGSGMTGGSVPERGGIVLNLERMDKIIRLDSEDRIAYVQPGVVTGKLQERAEECGLFYPPEPASSQFSTIGGNVAESAGGLGCVKYGLTKDFIAGLEFVTGTGEVIRTGIYADRLSFLNPGALVVGSEGTLGIVTEVALRLIPFPESRVTVLAIFSSLVEAAHASNAILHSGVGPSVLEFMDGECINTVRGCTDISIPGDAGSLVIVELDGDAESVSHGHRTLMDILERRQPLELKSARSTDEREALWKLRKSLSPAIAKIAPLKFNEDICVPVSQIPLICEYVETLGRRYQVKVVTFGHSGDGNIHVNFMTHWNKPDEIARIKDALGELFAHTVALGGTLSGEHGIGLAKRPFIGIALDRETIEFEKRIKRAFDPQNILNPGKIFPE